MFCKGTGAGYYETQDLLSKEIRFRTLICPRFSLILPVSTKNSKYLNFFRTRPSQITMIRSASFYTILVTQGLNRMDM
uniref:Uncharacterized protein n=1 Tax=Solanum lycopersicum TaxID=4081 RepID=A0A3Q7EC19_SOLLC